MNKSEIEGFLHAVDDELAESAAESERLDLYLLVHLATVCYGDHVHAAGVVVDAIENSPVANAVA